MLDLSRNDLVDSNVALILSFFQGSDYLTPIQSLKLNDSYWTENVTFKHLANLLASATALQTFEMGY